MIRPDMASPSATHDAVRHRAPAEEADRDCWYVNQYAHLLRRVRSPGPAWIQGVYTAIRQLMFQEERPTWTRPKHSSTLPLIRMGFV